MRKKVLKTIPIPKADVGKIHEIAIENENIRGVMISQKKKIDAEETLILNVYQVSGKNKKDISLLFRVFCQKDDYVTFDVDGNKWRTGALLYLVCRDSGWCEYWWNYHQLEFLTDRDAKRAENIFRRWNRNNSEQGGRAAFTLLDQYQQNVKNARLMKKHKKETDVIDVDMEKFGELPDDYQTFIEERVFKDENYIFYNTKRKRAFCTSCRKNFILKNKHLWHETIGIWNNEDEVRHNRTVRCPYCNKFLKAKSEGMGRQKLFAVQWSVLVQKHEDEVLVRYFCHTKDFRADFHNPKIESSERYRTVHTAEKTRDFEWGRFKSTQEIRWCVYKDKIYGYFTPPETVVPRSAVLYNDNLSEMVAGTCMKYSAIDIYLDKVVNNSQILNKPWCIDWYINAYRKTPYLEQLLKVGFYRIAQSVLEDRDCPNFKNGRTIMETLHINKLQFNMLRKIGNPSVRDVMILRYAKEIRQEDFDLLRYIRDYRYEKMYEKYIDMRQYTTIYKVDKYIKKQGIKHDADYFDYIRWLEEMGYDMRNEFNLYPKDFKKAHDDKSKEYVKFKDKRAKEDIKRFNKLLKKLRKDTSDVDAMNLRVEGMFIRLPAQLDELKREGEILHHCVGTYVDKVEKGETMIFFIRQESDPDKPFFTLEWKGRVVQCRGYRNCDMTPKVKAFVNIFQEKMVEYENEPKKHRKAG